MTHQSLAAVATPSHWIDQAFLWTASSLTVLTIVAAIPAPGVWPDVGDIRAAQAPAVRTAPPPVHALPQAPPPFIAFDAPVPDYPVISPFGLRQLPWEERGRLHAGVDIAAPSGTPVLAAADGVVARLGVDAGYGRFLEVRHKGGLISRYGHLSRFEPSAQPGSEVHRGQEIARIGSTGSSTGSHLHFEIRDGRDRALNPALFLGHAFPTQAQLPLKAAARWPRGVRVAYVSFIPAAKRELMAARDEEAAATAAAEAALKTPASPEAPAASTPVAIRPIILGRAAAGRVHARIDIPETTAATASN